MRATVQINTHFFDVTILDGFVLVCSFVIMGAIVTRPSLVENVFGLLQAGNLLGYLVWKIKTTKNRWFIRKVEE